MKSGLRVLQSAYYVYDGDGNLVKSVINGKVIYFIGKLYQKQVDGQTMTEEKTYFNGAQAVAMRTNETLYWLVGDHLGSTSLTTSADGTLVSELRYTAYGEVRYDNGNTPTKFQYTGQFSQMDEIGLYYYVARWFDPALMHFAQADSIVPGLANSVSYDRYGYARNNPVVYTDPSGHNPILIAAVILISIAILNGDPTPGYFSALIKDRQDQMDYYLECNKTFDEIDRNVSNSGEALITMFTTDNFPGDSPNERFEAILKGADSGSGKFMAGDFDDTGFQEQFRDGGDQVGHFLQAAGMAYNSNNTLSDYLYKSQVIGHEMIGDPESEGIWMDLGFVFQTASSLILYKSHRRFDSGTDENFTKILWSTGNPAGRRGNSIEDLRLSYKGWEFGTLMKSGGFNSRSDAAAWLKKTIAD